MKRTDLIKKIALETRAWAEQTNKKRENPFHDDLCGMCAIASAELFKRLVTAGITNARIAINDMHCFIMWQGFVVDITATQFNKARILFDKHSRIVGDETCRCSDAWHLEHVFHSVEDLVDHQIKVKWPPEQQVRIGC